MPRRTPRTPAGETTPPAGDRTPRPSPSPPPPPNPPPAPPTPATGTPAAPTRTRAARTPGRVTYSRHATCGTNDDRIVNPAWYKFLIVMLYIGGIAVLGWLVYGSFQAGASTRPAQAQPRVVIERPVQPQQPAPPPAPRELTPEERAEQYKQELRRQHGVH